MHAALVEMKELSSGDDGGDGGLEKTLLANEKLIALMTPCEICLPCQAYDRPLFLVYMCQPHALVEAVSLASLV
jgi:hypothetical protein